jgi:hypothetical protein
MLTRSRHAAARPVVFRKPQLAAFAWFVIAATGVMYAVAVFVVPANGAAFGVGIVIWPILYVMWLIGAHSAIRMDFRGVTVDNVMVRHVIPWDELSEIGVRNGLFFRLRDGLTIGSTSYALSLGAALTGYRYTKRVAGRMQQTREQLTATLPSRPAGPAGYSRRIALSPWPPLAILAVVETIALLSQLTR